MIVTHSGNTIDSTEDPIGAIELCLNAAGGAGSKRRAWDWAYDALQIVEEQFPEFHAQFRKLLGNGNFPTTDFNLDFLISETLYDQWVKNPKLDITQFQKALFLAFKIGERVDKRKLFSIYPDILPKK